MVRKISAAAAAVILAASCATFKPTPPSAYIEDIPASFTTLMTLDQRIASTDAWKSLREGYTERAQKILTKETAANPAYSVGLGYVALINYDLQSAEYYFKESASKFPDMTPAYVGLAQVYEFYGRQDQAFVQYMETVKRSPDNAWAKARLEKARAGLLSSSMNEARAALAAGNLGEAKRGYLAALFYDPEHIDAHLQLARIYRQENDLKNTVFHLKEALSRKPDDKLVLTDYAEVLYQAGNYSQSLDSYEKLAELDKNNKQLASRIEELREKLGIFEIPSQFEGIAGLEALTREDLAALIAVRLKDHLGAEPDRTRVIVDIAASWAQKFIVRVASLDIMKIYDNYTFQPRRIINRAELAETLANLLDYLAAQKIILSPVIDPRRIRIADLAPESYYYRSVLRVVSYQILNLNSQFNFEPERTVSGREANRALEVIARLAR